KILLDTRSSGRITLLMFLFIFWFSIFFIFSAVWSQSSIYSLKRCSVLVRLSRVLF
ncbi:unnamed protein product, partial [Brassica oleracea]